MIRTARSMLWALCLFTPQLASAQVVSSTQVRNGATNNKPFSFFNPAQEKYTFQLFDFSLGTLQRVRLAVSGSQTFSTTVTPTEYELAPFNPLDPTAINFIALYSGKRSMSGLILVPGVSGPVLSTGAVSDFSFVLINPTHAAGRTSTETVAFENEVELTSGAAFEAFLGTPSKSTIELTANLFSANQSGSFALGDGTVVKNDFGSYTLSLTYEYAPTTTTDPVPVPEPGSATLLAGGLVGLFTMARRRRDRTAAFPALV